LYSLDGGFGPTAEFSNMNYKDLLEALDAHFKSILNSLPKAFSSAQFIKSVSSFLPKEYSDLLKDYDGRTSAFRSVHVWISRWYLNSKASAGLIRKTQDKKTIKSVNGNNSKNTVWVKR